MARIPRWFQLGVRVMPALLRGTSQVPTNGVASSLRAQTASQLSPSMPVV
ncbi:hypothetical protein GGER_43940 [Serratia rubidaea]